jgi:hypothetical protein
MRRDFVNGAANGSPIWNHFVSNFDRRDERCRDAVASMSGLAGNGLRQPDVEHRAGGHPVR